VPNIRPLLPEGVYHWTATHPEWEGPVSAYAIDDGARLILIDPIAVPDDVRALFGSREVVTILTSTWHERDAAALGFPVWAPAPDRPEEQLVPATRYAIGDSLFGMEAYPGREGQLDLVLWSERIRAVIAGDTLIDLGNGLEIPASWLPEGVTVEQVATGLRPLLDKPVEIVLPTHGEPVERAALERALASSVRLDAGRTWPRTLRVRVSLRTRQRARNEQRSHRADPEPVSRYAPPEGVSRAQD
jgi:hypothetical protein